MVGKLWMSNFIYQILKSTNEAIQFTVWMGPRVSILSNSVWVSFCIFDQFSNPNQKSPCSINWNKTKSSYIIILERSIETLTQPHNSNINKNSRILPRFQAWASRKQVLGGGNWWQMTMWGEWNKMMNKMRERDQLSLSRKWEGEIRNYECFMSKMKKRTCVVWLVDLCVSKFWLNFSILWLMVTPTCGVYVAKF